MAMPKNKKSGRLNPCNTGPVFNQTNIKKQATKCTTCGSRVVKPCQLCTPRHDAAKAEVESLVAAVGMDGVRSLLKGKKQPERPFR